MTAFFFFLSISSQLNLVSHWATILVLSSCIFLTHWYTTEVIIPCNFSVSFIDTSYYSLESSFFHWCLLSYLHKFSVFTAGFLCHFPQWGWLSSQPHLVSLSILSWELKRSGTWMTPWMYEAHPYICICLSPVLCSAVFSLGFKHADIVNIMSQLWTTQQDLAPLHESGLTQASYVCKCIQRNALKLSGCLFKG